MLTALSVARDCAMIGQTDRVALVTVLPPSGNQAARIEYTFDVDKTASKVTSRPQQMAK